MNAALFSSESQTWNTPREVVEQLIVFEPAGVALDPCSNESSIVGARVEWRIERGEDGLVQLWSTDGLNYSNPPYDDIETWTKKMAREAARGCEIVALIPARTDTVAFQRHIFPCAAAICFWRGRMKYGAGRARTAQISLLADTPLELNEGENTAPFPSALIYWGLRPHRFDRTFSPFGKVVLL